MVKGAHRAQVFEIQLVNVQSRPIGIETFVPSMQGVPSVISPALILHGLPKPDGRARMETNEQKGADVCARTRVVDSIFEGEHGANRCHE